MITGRIYQVLVIALALLAGVQQIVIEQGKRHLAEVQQRNDAVRTRIADLTSRSLAATLVTVSAHAKVTQENENVYRKLQIVADASAVSERAAIQRLHDNAARVSRVTASPGEACPATLERSGDRLAAVGALADESDGLLQAAREIVRRRDGEVALLVGQITADRKALDGEK